MSLTYLASLCGEEARNTNLMVEQLEIIVPTQSLETAGQFIRTIQARLKTKTGNLFSQSDFDSDLKMLVQDYDRVEPHVEVRDGKIFIQLKIWQNPCIRRIIWEGVVKGDYKTLRKELGVKEGTFFNRIAFNKEFNKIKAYYVKEGFFEAQVSYDTSYDDLTNEVEITIRVWEGRAGKIKQIIFCNFTNEEEAELLEMMVTKKYNFFLSWLTNEGTYNEEAMQHDKFVVLNFLQNKGYADAKVDVETRDAPGCNNRIVIVITANRGAFYSVGEISIEGNCIFSEEDIRSRIDISPGDPFSPEQIHNLCAAIMDYYGKYGYIESVVTFEPQLVPGKYCFNVKILIDEGEKFCVGLIKVLGNCVTQTKVILHETLLVPGEVFNIEKLKRTEERLLNIGYFSNVNVYAVKTNEDGVLPGNYRDVHIEVEETNTGNLGAFFGFSTTDTMFGGINITERNFNIKGFRTLLSEGFGSLRGGGEYAHATLSLGTKTRSFALSWTKPYFMDTPWNVGFDIERSDTGYISKDIDIKTLSLTLHGSYICNAFVKVGPHFRVRYSDIDAHDDDDDKKNKRESSNNPSKAEDPIRAEDPTPNPSDPRSRRLKEEADKTGVIAAVGMQWMYSSVDHPICPTRGFRSVIEGEVAGFGGQSAFLSVAYLNTYYINLWDQATLKLRGDFRFLQPICRSTANSLPMDERFFLGGDNTIRGFRAYRPGPKFKKTEDGKSEDDEDEPKGGVSMQLFSIEVSRSIFSRLEAFAFFDIGALSIDTWHVGPFFPAVGYGARIKVFDGAPPLVLGMGYPIGPQHSSDVKKFFLTVGGKF